MCKLLHINKINNVISYKNKKNDCISIYSCNNIVSKKDTNYADVLYYLINEVMQLLPLGIKEVLYISKHEKDIANTKVNSIENLHIKQGYYEIEYRKVFLITLNKAKTVLLSNKHVGTKN